MSELDLVAEYFPEDSDGDDGYDAGGLHGDEEAPRPANAEMDLVAEYAAADFDADEVEGWRGVVSDIEAGPVHL